MINHQTTAVRSRNEAYPGSLLQEARGLREHQNEINRRLEAISQSLFSTPSDPRADNAKDGPIPDLVSQLQQISGGMNLADSLLNDIERYVFGVDSPPQEKAARGFSLGQSSNQNIEIAGVSYR